MAVQPVETTAGESSSDATGDGRDSNVWPKRESASFATKKVATLPKNNFGSRIVTAFWYGVCPKSGGDAKWCNELHRREKSPFYRGLFCKFGQILITIPW